MVVGWPPTQEKIRLAKQLGVDGLVGGPPVQPGQPNPDVWEFLPLLHARKLVEDAGLRLEVIESRPPMEKIILGLQGRDQQIDNFCKTLRNMGAAGIHIQVVGFSTQAGGLRTSLAKPTRGGALTTAFDYNLIKDAPPTEHGVITEDQIWDNWAYFMKRVLPVAEEANVRLALHPDDPPVPAIRGIACAFRSVEAFKRVIETFDSEFNGLTFCQGCFSEMDADVPEMIRYFGERKRIFFVHFRDVRGKPTRFEETFHDEGQTDMLATMRAYKEVGFDGPMRPDHVPTMEGDERYMGGHAGYTMLGRIYAIGYMKGLMEAVYGKQQPGTM